MRFLCCRCGLSIFREWTPTHFDVAQRTISLLDFWLVNDCSIINYSDQGQCPSMSHYNLVSASSYINQVTVAPYFD